MNTKKIIIGIIIILAAALALAVYFIFFRVPCCEQPTILDRVNALSEINPFGKESIENILRVELVKNESRSDEPFIFYTGSSGQFQMVELRDPREESADMMLDLVLLQPVEIRPPLTLGQVVERYGDNFSYFPSRLDAPTSLYCYLYSLAKNTEAKFCFTQSEGVSRESWIVREIIIERPKK